MQIPDWLARRADTHRDAAAVIHEGKVTTYAQLWAAARVRAGQLAALGVAMGDRVAVLMRHGLEYAVSVHAVFQAGAILVPVNWRLTPAEIAWQVRDAGARLLLHDEACRDLAEAVRDMTDPSVRLWNSERHPGPAAEPLGREALDLNQVCAILYTSGTTGTPKGAMLTFSNFLWSAMGSVLQLGLDPDERWLVPMPLFHVGGLSVLVRSVIYGTAAVIHDSFDARRVNQAIDEERITILSAVPTMLQRMLEARMGRPYPSSLRCVLLGGSGAPRPLLEACAAAGIPVCLTYGLTETTSQAATLMARDSLRKLGSSGKPLFMTDIRIMRDGRPAQPNEQGEIAVRGPTVMQGYWNRPDETQQAIRDGWLYTGDVGCLDEDGYLYVFDRRTDLIVSGGENIYPAEVESALTAHPAVAEAGVAGAPDPEWGQVPVAFVVCRADAAVTAEELSQFCRSRLAAYKVPKRFYFVGALPRNASGKLLRRTLREWASQ